MNCNNVICKIRLVVDDEPHETRRVSLEIPFASDIELFKEKMRAVFPQIARTPFDITWIDSDNDIITIANQEDLQEAMMSMEGIKKFEVHSSSKQEDDPADFFQEPPMPGVVTCDVCNNRITRYRYKCMQCPDYDLCLTCEQGGHHSHHIMMRLANLEIPRFLPKIIGHVSRSARKAAHHAAKEAHRCAKATARTAASAARGATAAAASAGQHRGPGCKRGAFHEAPIPTPGCPVMDTGFIYDLASSFLGPFTHAATSATATSHAGSSSQKKSEEKQKQEQKDQQPQANSQNENAAPNNTEAGPQIPFSPDMIGDVLKNIITAINSGVQSHASASSTGTSTPMHSTVSHDDVEIIHPSPNNTPTPSAAQGQNVRIIPMEVESNEIYPNLPKEPTATAPTNNNTGNNNQSAAPEPGWTIINNSTVPKETPSDVNKQASAPEAPSAPNEEDIKYAEALAQLKRMGFGENADLKNLLKRYDGNIGFVVNHLFDRGTHN